MVSTLRDLCKLGERARTAAAQQIRTEATGLLRLFGSFAFEWVSSLLRTRSFLSDRRKMNPYRGWTATDWIRNRNRSGLVWINHSCGITPIGKMQKISCKRSRLLASRYAGQASRMRTLTHPLYRPRPA